MIVKEGFCFGLFKRGVVFFIICFGLNVYKVKVQWPSMPNLPPAVKRKYVQLRELPSSVKETIKPSMNKVMCMILRAANCQTWAEPVAIIFSQRILGGNDAGTRQRATCLSHLWSWGQSLDYYDPDFFFVHSSNPKLTCNTLDTFVQMSSLLHKRQEDPRQPGGQEPWKTDLRTWTSSASWIIFHELTSLVSTCDVAKQFPSSSKRGWTWLWHVRR